MRKVPARRTRLADLLDRAIFAGLVLFLLGLPFHLVIKKLVPEPLGTYWKEILLALLVVLWVVRALLLRRPSLTHSPLGWAVLAYLMLLIVRFFAAGVSWVATWGLYVSTMYLPLFWLVASVLEHRPARLTPLLSALVVVGGVVSLGGLAEFVWNVPLWPSVETAQRQGFPGVFIYGTNIRRVYFTFDSPTTLANTLAVLLPLALSLLLAARRPWARLAAALAATLTAACIVVTFSRGIWVATLVSLVVMGVGVFLAYRSRRGTWRRWRKALLVIGGAIAVLATAWGIVWAAWRPWEDTTYEGVVELSPGAFQVVPLTRGDADLLTIDPSQGYVVTQTWSISDPVTGQVDTRTVLYEHPLESGKTEIIYQVDIPIGGALRFGIALSPEVWSPVMGDGVSFEVYIADRDRPREEPALERSEGQPVFVRYVNPKDNHTDRRWRNFLVDLTPWAGRTVNLSLVTDAGRAGDWSFDWAGWAEPEVVSVAPGAFAAAQQEGAIIRHTASILDWVRDETNRDRLAAWSQGLSAWRSAPLWGTGLGTTGVAALRTRPEQALVTESQALKALVELGPLGLLVLAFLWFQIFRTGYRAFRAEQDPVRQMLLLGVSVGLLVVFVEGWVYQNLEVKQVNAYFWTLVGALAFLAWPRSDSLEDADRPATRSALKADRPGRHRRLRQDRQDEHRPHPESQDQGG